MSRRGGAPSWKAPTCRGQAREERGLERYGGSTNASTEGDALRKGRRFLDESDLIITEPFSGGTLSLKIDIEKGDK